METIKELEKEKDLIFDKINSLEAKRLKLEAKRLKEDMPALKKKYLGKCFKYKNCYSMPSKPSDYWWLYIKITGIEDNNYFRAMTFEDDGKGRIEFEINKWHSLFDKHIPITFKEYKKQGSKILQKLIKHKSLT